MSTVDLITKETVLRTLEDIIRENPTTINPTSGPGGSCVYHRREGTGIQRCLVGEMAHRLNLPEPDANEGSAWEVATMGTWASFFEPDAITLMDRAQTVADGGGLVKWQHSDAHRKVLYTENRAQAHGFTTPRPWGDIKVADLDY